MHLIIGKSYGFFPEENAFIYTFPVWFVESQNSLDYCPLISAQVSLNFVLDVCPEKPYIIIWVYSTYLNEISWLGNDFVEYILVSLKSLLHAEYLFQPRSIRSKRACLWMTTPCEASSDG